MTDILLPTQQLNLSSTHTQRGVSNRAVAPTPNDKIAFQIDNAKKLAPLTDAIDVIDKFQEKIKKEKQEALINQASNLYKEVVGSEAIRYQNLKGDEAVKGLDEHNKNLDAINKKFSHTFKNVNMQMTLDKNMQNANLNARLNSQNWHDKQVIEVANQERLATLQVTGEQTIQGLGTPNDKNNLAEMQKAMQEVIFKNDGITDVNSNAYKVRAEHYYDEAFKLSLANQVKENPSMAMVNLNRVKGLISDNLYRKLMISAKDEQRSQYKESLQIEKLKQDIEDAKTMRENYIATHPMSTSHYDKVLKDHIKEKTNDFLTEHNLKEDQLTKEQKSEIYQTAEKLAQKEKLVWDTNVKQWGDDTARLQFVLGDSVTKAIKDGSFNAQNPLASLEQEEKKVLIANVGSESKAVEFVKDMAFRLDANAYSLGGKMFNTLTPTEKMKLYHNPQDLLSFVQKNKISQKDLSEFMKSCEKVELKVSKGDDLFPQAILNHRDSIARQVNKNVKNYRELERLGLDEVVAVQEVMSFMQKGMAQEYEAKHDPMVYSEANSAKWIEKARLDVIPQIKAKSDTRKELVNDIYDVFDRASSVNDNVQWTNSYDKEQRKQLINEKILEYEDANDGKLPSKDEGVRIMKEYAFKTKANSDRYLGTLRWAKENGEMENSLLANLKMQMPSQPTSYDYIYETGHSTDVDSKEVENMERSLNTVGYMMKLLSIFADDQVKYNEFSTDNGKDWDWLFGDEE